MLQGQAGDVSKEALVGGHTAPSKLLRLEGGGNASPGTVALTQINEREISWGWTISFN